MIELTSADVAVLFRQACQRGLDYLPTAQLNDDGQTEIVRWIESVGKLDDQLSPYAWYSLAEEAATANDPDDPLVVEMLPTYTLSGETETLELCRARHFDWSIEAVPVEYIENADELLDAGVPLRFLLLAEAAGEAFAKCVGSCCPEIAAQAPQLMLMAANAFLRQLCDGAGLMLDEAEWFTEQDSGLVQLLDEAEWAAVTEQGIEAARDVVWALDPELEDEFLPTSLSGSDPLNVFSR